MELKSSKVLLRIKEANIDVDDIGFYLTSDYRVDLTPIDAITFAATGGDGIHFCFLTDFESYDSLDECPIIIVSHTNDPPIKLVARNILDFFSILLSVKNAEELDHIDYGNEEEEWIQEIITSWYDSDEAKNTLKLREENLTKLFGIKAIDSIYNYHKSMVDDRNNSIIIETVDELGIIQKTKNDAVRHNLDFSDLISKDVVDKTLNSPIHEEIFAFCRDSQFHDEFRFNKYSKKKTYKKLKSLNLKWIANNLKEIS